MVPASIMNARADRTYRSPGRWPTPSQAASTPRARDHESGIAKNLPRLMLCVRVHAPRGRPASPSPWRRTHGTWSASPGGSASPPPHASRLFFRKVARGSFRKAGEGEWFLICRADRLGAGLISVRVESVECRDAMISSAGVETEQLMAREQLLDQLKSCKAKQGDRSQINHD